MTTSSETSPSTSCGTLEGHSPTCPPATVHRYEAYVSWPLFHKNSQQKLFSHGPSYSPFHFGVSVGNAGQDGSAGFTTVTGFVETRSSSPSCRLTVGSP